MKHNVDLTDNMDFSRDSEIQIQSFLRHTKFVKDNNFPWNSKSKGQDSKSSQLFYTGNNAERKQSKLIRDICSSMQCDCCGKRLLPWEDYKGLCKKCFDYLEESVSGKIPWKEK